MTDEKTTAEPSGASGGYVAGEPVAWSIQWHGETRPDVCWTYEDKNTAEICLAGCVSKGVVVPLYRQPTLTDAERDLLEWLAAGVDDRRNTNQTLTPAARAALRGLLERTGGGR